MVSRPTLLSQRTLNIQRATIPWARIASVTGAASDTTYTDAAGVTWRCVQWTANATNGLVVTPGYVELLIVAGGAGGKFGNWTGHGAYLHGLHLLSGAQNVTIGAGGAGGAGAPGGSLGGASFLGSLMARTGIEGGFVSLMSSITGVSQEYARPSVAAARANFGDGGESSSSASGSSGLVVVRVPA